MTISPEAYQLVSQAPLPSEFERIVREGIPAMKIPDLPRTDPGIDMVSFETTTLELPVEPVEMPALAALAETDRSPNLDATLSYLSEWRLDLTGVAHMTPGLQELADLPLGSLICETQGSEDGWVFLCQRDGDDDENGEGDEDGGPPVGEGIHTVVRGGCQLSAEFRLRGAVGPKDTRRLSKLQPIIDLLVDLQQDKTLTPLLMVVPEKTKDYPGTLRFWWTLDGRKIPLTKSDDKKNFVTSAGDTDEIKISAKDAADLKAKLDAQAEETKRAGAGFFVRIPKELNATTPRIEQSLEGHARWKPDSHSEECPLDEGLTLYWHLRTEPVIPQPEDKKDGDQIVASGTTVDHIDREGTPFLVLPLVYSWRVEDVLVCCGERKPHEVIQFARVVYESDYLRKGHDWALDIREAEKQRARADEPYDPRFTNDPRGSNPGGSMIGPGQDGRPAIRQKDAPGITRQRYDELTLASRRVPVRFQFLAFLVCPPDGTGDNPEDDYLGAKVVRVTLHEVLWDFPGRLAGNRPTPPTIKVGIKEIVNVRCRETLGAYLDKNGLRNAYDRPVSSETRDLPQDEHRKLRDAVSNAEIKKP